MAGGLIFAETGTGRAPSRSIGTQTENAADGAQLNAAQREKRPARRRAGRTQRRRSAPDAETDEAGTIIERSRRRMSAVGRHYRELHSRHVALRRRFRHVRRQHQVIDGLPRADDAPSRPHRAPLPGNRATSPSENGAPERVDEVRVCSVPAVGKGRRVRCPSSRNAAINLLNGPCSLRASELVGGPISCA